MGKMHSVVTPLFYLMQSETEIICYLFVDFELLINIYHAFNVFGLLNTVYVFLILKQNNMFCFLNQKFEKPVEFEF